MAQCIIVLDLGDGRTITRWFDPALGTWDTSKNPLPTKLRCHGVASTANGDYAVLAGGYVDGATVDSAATYVYTAATDSYGLSAGVLNTANGCPSTLGVVVDYSTGVGLTYMVLAGKCVFLSLAIHSYFSGEALIAVWSHAQKTGC